jgi:phosphoserine phosphatase
MTQFLDKDVPLCIDCDGTLLRTDLLHESVLLLLKQAPVSLIFLPWWLLRGKAYLKERIAERVRFDWSTLPYCAEILTLISVARARGRLIVLATASPLSWASGIAKHLGVFDATVATANGINLSGKHKAQRLCAMYGAKQFDYAGNSRSDLPVWAAARSAIVVSSSKGLISMVQRTSDAVQVLSSPRAGSLIFAKGLRIHQWVKNLLVLAPLLAAHKISDVDGFIQAGLAFLAFSFCASAVYVLNDLLDLEADRQHIRKHKRPFASAAIPIWQGLALVPLLLGGAFLLAWPLPFAFTAVLMAYFVMTLAYSLRLKRQVIVDVMLLSALYTMRIIAGAAATGIIPSSNGIPSCTSRCSKKRQVQQVGVIR